MVKCLYIEDYQKEALILYGKKEIGLLNLAEIQSFIQSKKIKSSDKIDLALLKKLNIVKKKYKKLKVLGKWRNKRKIKY